MSINTTEPLHTKKLCANLLMSAIPHTDQGGIYRGESQSIWIRTSAPLSKDQRQHLEEMGVLLTQPNPTYSQGTSFVYVADLQPEANLRAFLALRNVLQVRSSERLEPSQEYSPARSALEDLKISSGAPLRFIENMNEAGVAKKAQRILLSAVENRGYNADGAYDDHSHYKEQLADTISASLVRASHRYIGGSRTTPTRALADALRDEAGLIRSEASDESSLPLAQDLEELSEQLRSIAE